MDESVVIKPYDDSWPVEFSTHAAKMRNVLGHTALRIDHIGSTSVVGLHAKPIIDIQVSVQDIRSIESYKPQLQSIGFLHRLENPDKTKMYFRETAGTNRTHIHVRDHGSWSQQMALLFRDYLRMHSEDCIVYANEKCKLMELYSNDRPNYVEGKRPVIWTILQKAHVWSQQTGWKPGNTDF